MAQQWRGRGNGGRWGGARGMQAESHASISSQTSCQHLVLHAAHHAVLGTGFSAQKLKSLPLPPPPHFLFPVKGACPNTLHVNSLACCVTAVQCRFHGSHSGQGESSHGNAPFAPTVRPPLTVPGRISGLRAIWSRKVHWAHSCAC